MPRPKKEKKLPNILGQGEVLKILQATDSRYIQELLGHSSSKTTEIYTHATEKSIMKILSPLDRIDKV